MVNRNIVYIIVAIIVVGGLWFTKPNPAVLPHGIYLPATQQNLLPTDPANLQLYENMPANAKVVGNISVERLSVKANEIAQQQQIIDYAKQLAANNGATGLVVQSFFAADPGEGLKPQYWLRAQAITQN